MMDVSDMDKTDDGISMGNMEDHNHMKMDMGGMGMNMDMGGHMASFHFSRRITVLVSYFQVDSALGMALVTIIFVLISMCYEGLRCLRMHLATKHGHGTKKITMTSRSHVIQTVLYLGEFVVGYALMLMVMTFNAWLLLSVILGSVIGFTLCKLISGPHRIPGRVASPGAGEHAAGRAGKHSTGGKRRHSPGEGSHSPGEGRLSPGVHEDSPEESTSSPLIHRYTVAECSSMGESLGTDENRNTGPQKEQNMAPHTDGEQEIWLKEEEDDRNGQQVKETHTHSECKKKSRGEGTGEEAESLVSSV